MKDIVITSKTLKREFFIALGCFVVAFCINIFAILKYDRPAVELISQIGFVVVIAVIIYVLLWVLRLLALAVKSLLFRKK